MRCGHWARVVYNGWRYCHCLECGQVLRPYGYPPLLHNGKKPRK